MEYSSDEELMYEREEQKRENSEYDDLDLFRLRNDENGKILNTALDEELSVEDTITQHV